MNPSDDLRGRYGRIKRAMERVNNARGEFLSSMIFLEELIDTTILSYFRPDEATIFVENVLSAMNLSRKIELVRRLARKHGLLATHRHLFVELDRLRGTRNRFAHKAFMFMDHEFRAGDENYRVAVHNRAKPGRPDPERAFDLSDLNRDVEAAAEAGWKYMGFLDELLSAHTDPSEEYERSHS